jgi:hypothetical protein
MRWRSLGVAGGLIVVLLALAAFGWRAGRADAALPDGVDPAFEAYTHDRSASYAGIDHWAFYGMRVERVVSILEGKGYGCRAPHPATGSGKLEGIHEVVCDRKSSWPLARTLSIKASIEYGLRGRLVAATASSSLSSDDTVHRGVARVLRRVGLMEPATLVIRGFEVDSADLLARQAVDALRLRDWHMFCEGNEDTTAECDQALHDRRANGFAPLPHGPVQVIKSPWLDRAMERVRLMPAAQQHADVWGDDGLLLRVSGNRMWADFASRDLVGRHLSVSIALNSAGGAPEQLVASVDGQSRTVQLSGTPERVNNGGLRYLVPARGMGNPRQSLWLDLPDAGFPQLLKQVGYRLGKADPAFARPLIKTFLDDVIKPIHPEERLHLYPVLRSIEEHAAILHNAHVELWLLPEQAVAFIRDTYPDDPATRASWALGNCEMPAGHLVIAADCWERLTDGDPTLLAMLNSQVAQLQERYATLDAAHPIRMHLAQLAAALAHAQSGGPNSPDPLAGRASR